MAKIRKLRQKYNASLSKQSNKPEVASSNPRDIFRKKMESFLQNNQKVKSVDKLSKVIAKRSNLRKNDKRLHRRKLLLKKIDILSKDQKEKKEKIKREKTLITGDMKPLVDALPTLDELLSKGQSSKTKNAVGDSSSRKLKNGEKKAIAWQQDLQTFNKVLHHSAFQQSPFESITAYLTNKITDEY